MTLALQFPLRPALQSYYHIGKVYQETAEIRKNGLNRGFHVLTTFY